MPLTNQHIDTLLVLCQDGNQLAQLEVYNRYQAAMFNIAMRILKNTAEAEDVMQESFITAFSKLSSFKGEASFGAWLKRIVVNNALTQYKKSKRFTLLPEENIKDSTYDEEQGIAEAEYASTKVKQVLQLMDTLHSSYRTVLTLHFIEGYDYEEICELLQITNANCRTLISRGKESLRNKFMQTT